MLHYILKILLIIDNFGKQFNPFFLKKSKTLSITILKNKDKTISNNDMVAEEFSSFFENAIKPLNISPRNVTLCVTTNLSNHVEIVTKKFENHPIVQIIKEYIFFDQEINFEQVSIDDILKEMKNVQSFS